MENGRQLPRNMSRLAQYRLGPPPRGPEKVTLFIDWHRNAAVQTFLAGHYAHFAAILTPPPHCPARPALLHQPPS
jgi:hypothetical protein